MKLFLAAGFPAAIEEGSGKQPSHHWLPKVLLVPDKTSKTKSSKARPEMQGM